MTGNWAWWQTTSAKQKRFQQRSWALAVCLFWAVLPKQKFGDHLLNALQGSLLWVEEVNDNHMRTSVTFHSYSEEEHSNELTLLTLSSRHMEDDPRQTKCWRKSKSQKKGRRTPFRRSWKAYFKTDKEELTKKVTLSRVQKWGINYCYLG